MSLKILFFGDIVGKIGRQALSQILPKMKEELEPDLVIANAENLAHGLGITKKTIQEVKEAGVDFFTSGNHVWNKSEGNEILSEKDPIIIRPANYPEGVSGLGEKVIELGTKKLLVINLLGRVFMDIQVDCPFKKFDEIYKKYESKKLAGILVDFHAEATSEKVALGWYLDGRASAVLGTHTHIATSDNRIFPQGTGFVSDIGMVGARDSVIGDTKESVLKRFLTQLPEPLEIPETGWVTVNSVLVEIDPKTKRATSIKRVDKEVEIR